MYSITLQNAGGDNVIGSGDKIGRINFAASAESDGGAATYITSYIACEAEGSFSSSSNPAGITFATSSSDSLPATGRLNISSDGNFLPLASGQYDLGSSSFPFRNLYLDGGYVTAPTGVFEVISFNVDNESILSKGEISWSDTEGSLTLGLTDNTTVSVGESRYLRIRNETGATLYKGQVVYATGVHSNGLITPDLYVADGSIREIRFMGVVLEDVNINNNGYALDFGQIIDMDLDGSASNYAVGDETWVAGDILYVHPTVAGKLTKVEPKHSISVAIVLDPGNGNGNGRMFVRPTSYGHLDDNHDVNVSGVLNNQFLVYDSVSDYWQPSSGLYYVDGDLGIGTASPPYKLDVNGTTQIVPTAGLDTLYLNRVTGKATIKSTPNQYMIIDSDTNFLALNYYENAPMILGYGGGNVMIGTATTPTSKLQVEGGDVTFNDLGGNYDFRVEGSGDPNLLFTNASTDRVGIGTASPSHKLHVAGSGYFDSLQLQSNYYVNYPIPQILGGSTNTDQIVLFAPNGVATVFRGYIDHNFTATSNEYLRNFSRIFIHYRTSSTIDVVPQVTVNGVYNGNQSDLAANDNGRVVKVLYDGIEYWGLIVQDLSSFVAAIDPVFNGYASSVDNFRYGYRNTFTAVTDITPNANSGRSASLFRYQNLSVPDGNVGIGTNNPSVRLGVEGGDIVFNDNGGNYDFRVESVSDTHLLYVDGSTNSRVGIGTASPSSKLDINADTIRLRTAKTPSSASDTGNTGDICWDSNYVYVCVATNTWKRSPLSTW